MHDAIHRRFPEDYRGWWIRYLEFMVPRVLRRAAAVIADSECTKRDLIDAFGLDPGVVRVIYLGVDLHRFNRQINCTSLRIPTYARRLNEASSHPRLV